MAKQDMLTYEQTLEWIHDTPRFSRNLGLNRFLHLLERLGNPHRRMKFVHVAGTNGKGSVTAMIASVLKASGLRTGMYTSPELEDFRERIMVNGVMIPVQSLCRLARQVRAACQDMVSEGHEHPVQFELITAIAFLYFAEASCQYVSLEVGLGGRYDATNVVVPDVSVITTVSLDHTEVLGNTLPEIAFEKAGIIKMGVPVVTGVTEKAALDVIRAEATRAGSNLIVVGSSPGYDVTWDETSYSIEGQAISVRGPGFQYENLRIPLLGRHQQLNAAVALSALNVLRRSGVDLAEDAIRQGMASTVWPGRLEVMSRAPLVILDGAHNPDGARMLKDFLRDVPRKRLICVLGVLGDKLYRQITDSISPLCDHIITTTPSSPRALPPDQLAREVKRVNAYADIEIEPEPARAIDRAMAIASSDDLVLCCGSLYLVGPIRAHLRSRFGC